MSDFEYYREASAYVLASVVGVSAPDSSDSLGGKFLRQVRNAFYAAVDSGELREAEYPEDFLHSLADSSVTPYYHEQWGVFVDLELYHHEDMDEAPQSAMMASYLMFLVASQLLSALEIEYADYRLTREDN